MEQISTITIKIVKTIITAVRTYIQAFAFAATLAIGAFIIYMILARLLPRVPDKLLHMIFRIIDAIPAKRQICPLKLNRNVKLLSAKDRRPIKDAHKDIIG